MQFGKLNLLLITVISAVKLDSKAYPTADVKAPINATWTTNALQGKTIADVAPRVKAGISDMTLGHTNCLNANQLALTYDDGPTTLTNKLLDQLKAQNVKATFFVVGSRVINNPDILLRAYNEGHEIAIHTWSHPAQTTITNDQIVAEIVWNAKIIKDVIGVTPRVMRPPCMFYN